MKKKSNKKSEIKEPPKELKLIIREHIEGEPMSLFDDALIKILQYKDKKK